MAETTNELEDRIVTALRDVSMTRDTDVAELQQPGWTNGLALDFVSVIVDYRGQ